MGYWLLWVTTPPAPVPVAMGLESVVTVPREGYSLEEIVGLVGAINSLVMGWAVFYVNNFRRPTNGGT